MICVGLTGGIGSGKSYISRIFQNLSVPVYDSDQRAKYLTNNDPRIKSQIISFFGADSFINDTINSKLIGGMVFDNPAHLNKLNSIIHPVVEADFKRWCSEHEKSAYIIKEAAIIFETGIYKKLDKNILVTAPERIRIERIMNRDKLSEELILKRMKNQWEDREKEVLADYIINNSGSQLILPQVIKIHNTLTD